MKKEIYASILIIGIALYAIGIFANNFVGGQIYLSPGEEKTLFNYLSPSIPILILSGVILITAILFKNKNKNYLQEIHQGKKDYKRKKILGVKERKFRISVDNAIYLLAFLGPLFSIPQILEILTENTINSSALFSWSSYLAIGFAWFIYGTVHKYKPLMLTYGAWIIIEIIVISKIILGT